MQTYSHVCEFYTLLCGWVMWIQIVLYPHNLGLYWGNYWPTYTHLLLLIPYLDIYELIIEFRNHKTFLCPIYYSNVAWRPPSLYWNDGPGLIMNPQIKRRKCHKMLSLIKPILIDEFLFLINFLRIVYQTKNILHCLLLFSFLPLLQKTDQKPISNIYMLSNTL